MTEAPERVILRVLQEARRQLGRPVTRTELVKLVYLVDYFYAQHTEGQTISGFEYMWADHGPNAVGNQIVKRADYMDDTIDIYEGVTTFGNSKFLYQSKPDIPDVTIDGLADALIVEVVRSYGHLGWKRLTAFAKSTRPMRGIQQGDRLDLRPNPVFQQVVETIRTRMRNGAYATRGARVSLAELKQGASPPGR